MSDNGKDPKTGRFVTGNNGGGRPKGAKSKLQEAFWRDFHEAWAEGGKSALASLLANDPGKFVTVAASLMPKNLEAEVAHTITGVRWMTEQEWLASLTGHETNSETSMSESGDTQFSSPIDEQVRH